MLTQFIPAISDKHKAIKSNFSKVGELRSPQVSADLSVGPTAQFKFTTK